MTTESCWVCGKAIPEKQMEKDLVGGVFADMLEGGVGAYTTPNAMQELAMKCNQCGVWIDYGCARQTVDRSGAGAIQHECGGMFETPH
jgi:hypothetical protein